MKKITTLTLIVAFGFCTLQSTAQNTVASYFVTDNNNQVVFEKSDNIYIKLAYSKNDVKVMWQTSIEKNTKSFEIQASNDGNSFETLQVLDAKNNTTKKSKYAIALNQQQSAPGKRVFRIKVNFNDGTAYFSQTVTYMMVLRANTDNMVNAVNNDALYF
jgi:hypothetical protein